MRSAPSKTEGYVYAGCAGEYMKLGGTASVDARMRHFRTILRPEMRVAAVKHVRDIMFAAEKLLHMRFEEFRVPGTELFDIPAHVAQHAIDAV